MIVEGEILKLGGPFLNSWQKRHLRLYPNRLEFYQKNRDGGIQKNKVELITMYDIKEVCHDFQKLNKADNCIVMILKNETKLVITSQDKVLINQWKEEILGGFRASTKMQSKMNKKASKLYGADVPIEHRNSNGS